MKLIYKTKIQAQVIHGLRKRKNENTFNREPPSNYNVLFSVNRFDPLKRKEKLQILTNVHSRSVI